MTTKFNDLSHIKNLKTELNYQEKAVLLLIVSLFISVYVAAICAISLVFYLILSGEIRPIFTEIKGGGLLFLFMAVLGISTLLYGNTLSLLVGLGISILLVLVLFLRQTMTRRLFDQIVDVSCLMSFPAFLVALLQKWKGDGVAFGGRMESVFYNPNYYATMIEIVVLFALARMLKEQKNRWFYSLVVTVNLAGLGLCQCRTSIVVIAVSIFVLLVFMKKRLLLFIYVIGAIFCVAAVLTQPDLFPRGDVIGRDLDTRTSIWYASLQGFFDSPLIGNGVLSYGRIALQYGGFPTTHAHNLFLELLLNYGLVGAGIVFGYLGIVVHKILRVGTVDRFRAAMALAVLSGILVHGLVDATVFWPQTGLLAAAVLAVSDIYEPRLEQVIPVSVRRFLQEWR